LFVFDPARAPADVGRHGNYNKSSLGTFAVAPNNEGG
jgi:hypothetical protein